MRPVYGRVQPGTEELLRKTRATAAILRCDVLKRRVAWGHIGKSRLYYFRGRPIALQRCDHSVVRNRVDTVTSSRPTFGRRLGTARSWPRWGAR